MHGSGVWKYACIAEPSKDRCDRTRRLQCQVRHIYESIRIVELKMYMCTHIRAHAGTDEEQHKWSAPPARNIPSSDTAVHFMTFGMGWFPISNHISPFANHITIFSSYQRDQHRKSSYTRMHRPLALCTERITRLAPISRYVWPPCWLVRRLKTDRNVCLRGW